MLVLPISYGLTAAGGKPWWTRKWRKESIGVQPQHLITGNAGIRRLSSSLVSPVSSEEQGFLG